MATRGVVDDIPSGRKTVQQRSLSSTRVRMLALPGGMSHGDQKLIARYGLNISKWTRRRPLHFAGYTIACRRFGDRRRAAVRLDRNTFRCLKDRLEAIALHRDVERLKNEFQNLRVELYAAVRRQFFMLLRGVNETRRICGTEVVPTSALRLHRRSVVAVKESR